MTAPAVTAGARREPVRTPRRYLMCPPTHFAVSYAINPWMDPAVPVDVDRATRQWETLRQTYVDLGHTVELVAPHPELSDMVFAANSALVVDGRVYGARFRHAERAGESGHYREWFAANGITDYRVPEFVNEGEGDFCVVGDLVLAASGYRTDVRAHREAQEFLGRPVVSLTLVDPRFYHLDTALFALDHQSIAYYPGAFSAPSRRLLRRMFPDAVLAEEADAVAFGLNSVSDGHHVVIDAAATGLANRLADKGYRPVPVDLGELRKAGGGAKCCTQEIRVPA